MWLKAGNAPEVAVEAPGLLFGVSASLYSRVQVFAPCALSSVHIQADLDFARAYLHVDTSPMVRRAFDAADAPFFEAQAADAAIQAVAGQILAVSGPAGHPLFQAAKALELMALVLGHEGPTGCSRRPRSLTPTEQGRIEAAHVLLLERLDTAPDLTAIARRTGLNPSKLNRGFRATYGMTPYAFLQERRLQIAYRMLASERASVGEVALAIGYSPAHFATLFRRRFGLAPSSLVAARSSPL
ncbi:AraC-like DNA-binding protein [Methylobacterium sp. B4]|nr:AraC-like DNA-binding protein [Methylobacterium sp. B4]